MLLATYGKSEERFTWKNENVSIALIVLACNHWLCMFFGLSAGAYREVQEIKLRGGRPEPEMTQESFLLTTATSVLL